MNHKISKLQSRYELSSKQSVYDRMKALDIKPVNRGEISSKSLDKLDKLNEFMKNNAGKEIWEFPKDTEFDRAISLAKELGVSLKTIAKSFGLDIEEIPNDETINHS